MIERPAIDRDLVIVACAISAGVHAGLAPEHFGEGAAAGLAFAASAILLAIAAVAVTWAPSAVVLAGVEALLAGLLAVYALAITTGVPVVHPEPEAVDGLALFTKAVEAAGLIGAVRILRLRPPLPIPLGLSALIAVFSALAALALSGGHHHT